MRRKRHKATRRTLRFLRVNAGFREPYKVLLDGNFAHALRTGPGGGTTAPDAVVARLLGGRARVLTTRCVLAELSALGGPYVGTAAILKAAAAVHACGHDGAPLDAAACLRACVGDGNVDHFIVATQDRGLRSALARVPAGASMFVSAAGPALEPPSDAQRDAARGAAAVARAPRREELAGGGGDEGRPRRAGPAFRRKRAGGPNPLSVKKKKKERAAAAVKPPSAGAAGAGVAAASDKAKRKRKRTRGGGGGGGETAAA